MSASPEFEPEFDPPDAILVNRRWVKVSTVDWVKHANKVMVEHGAVTGNTIYQKRHQARWRAQRLIQLMVELGLHARWELSEHTNRKGDGWQWTVEYIGRGGEDANSR